MMERVSKLAATVPPAASFALDTCASASARVPRGRRTAVWSLLSRSTLALALASAPLAASVQISDGLPYSDVDFTSTRPLISPNGQWAVYREDSVIDGLSELWSVPIGGGAPNRLTSAWSANHFVNFAISPDSSTVVYTCDQTISGRTDLYSVPIDGFGSPNPLTQMSNMRNVLSFVISPTNDRVFFIADKTNNDKYELYSVPIDGLPTEAVRINADICSDCDVESYRVSPDGNTVIYRAGQTALAFWELFSVPSVGPPEVAVKISRFIDLGGGVDAYFQISADGTKVVYRADPTTSQSFNLYSVSIFGGSSIQLNASPSVDTVFLISPDSSRVVFRSGNASTGQYSLYSNQINGGTAVRLNTSLGTGETVATGFQISSDSAKVVYKSDEDADNVDELYSVPLAGGTPTKLNPPLVAGGDVLDFQLSPNGARAVYRADQGVDSLNELWSVPIGGGAVTKLNRTLTSGGDVQNFRISPNNAWVLYGADQDVDTVDEVLAVPLAGGTVLDVNGPLVSGGDVVLYGNPSQTQAYDLTSNSQKVLYAADEDFNDEVSLYVATLAGPPGAPTGVVAAPGNAQATVTFEVPASDGGSGITGFTVTSNPAGGIDSNAGTTALTHLMTNLVNGTPYTFTVRASNINGPGDPSLPSNSVIPGTPPGAAANVVATPRNNSADVVFDPPASDGGSPILGYTVTSTPLGGLDINAGSLLLRHVILGLKNTSAYTFKVVAVNLLGPGPASAPSNAVTPGCVPDVVNVFCDGVEVGDTSAWDTVVPFFIP